jgi:UDP-N-acetylglucosamine 2-epimerase (non-hydrolysing)
MSKKPTIYCIVAARPNFMKIAPIMAELEKQGELKGVLIHTGQHYDSNMSDVFFSDLNIPVPDMHLGIGSGTHAEQTGKLMIAFEKLCMDERPDIVLVVGDVNATVACSLVAAKLHIPVAHVEAGLRSGDRRMPEEINRIVTDGLSDLLFTTCGDADNNLIREGIDPQRIHFTGNVMVDTLLENMNKLDADAVISEILGPGYLEADYALLTMHRPSNVDHKQLMEGWVSAFESVSQKINLVCPAHPRTEKQLRRFGLFDRFKAAVKMMKPLGYLQFVALMKNARLVITDSGGLQEESTMLGVPCLTIRENTERPVTITHGTNVLAGVNPDDLQAQVERVLESAEKTHRVVPDLWDGHAAQRIVKILAEKMSASD